MPFDRPTISFRRFIHFAVALCSLTASKSLAQQEDEKAENDASGTKSGLEALIGSEHAWRIVSVILALALLLTIIAIILLVCVVLCMAKEAREKNRDYRYNRGYTR